MTFKSALAPYVHLCRPQEWVKNLFLLAPLLFSGQARDLGAVVSALWAFTGFCLWSSAVYCANDALDARADCAHPRKRRRPVASGAVSPGSALSLAVALFLGGLPLIAIGANGQTALFGGLYLINSAIYVLALKAAAILDVLTIAVGFVLRLLAGCSAVETEPSPWLLICGFSLALLLGFGKRRLELANLERPEDFRPALRGYSLEKLNLTLGVSASLCLLSYMLYATAPETVALHRTRDLIYTVPFVAYGVFRFLFKIHDGEGDGPADILLRDPIFAANGILWVICSGTILYLGH